MKSAWVNLRRARYFIGPYSETPEITVIGPPPYHVLEEACEREQLGRAIRRAIDASRPEKIALPVLGAGERGAWVGTRPSCGRERSTNLRTWQPLCQRRLHRPRPDPGHASLQEARLLGAGAGDAVADARATERRRARRGSDHGGGAGDRVTWLVAGVFQRSWLSKSCNRTLSASSWGPNPSSSTSACCSSFVVCSQAASSRISVRTSLSSEAMSVLGILLWSQCETAGRRRGVDLAQVALEQAGHSQLGRRISRRGGSGQPLGAMRPRWRRTSRSFPRWR